MTAASGGDAFVDAPQDEPASGETTIRVGSAAGLVSEIVAAALGFVTGIVTARTLGADGKGLLSTMSYIAVIAGSLSGPGLGEAGIEASVQGTATLQAALSTTLVMVAAASVVGTATFLAVAAWQYSTSLDTLVTSLTAIGAMVPLVAAARVLPLFLHARNGFILSALSRVVLSTVTAIATFAFVIVMRRDLSGAAVALFTGWAASTLVILYGLHRVGFSLRPAFDRSYAAAALRFGFPVGMAYILTVLIARVDLIMVQAMQGVIPAGRYSVALTVAALVTYGPFVIANVAYPSVAEQPGLDVGAYVARLSRLSALAALVPGVVLAAIVPWALPLAFGDDFRGSVGPAILLIAGSVIWGVQWMLCRARTARGDNRVLLRSFGTSVGGIVLADLVLIPLLGSVGAGLGFLIASIAGLVVVLVSYARRERVVWHTLVVPRSRDVAELVEIGRSLLRSTSA